MVNFTWRSNREIGRILSRSHSTILRDVHLPGRDLSRYIALHAQKLADKRNLLSGRKRFVDRGKVKLRKHVLEDPISIRARPAEVENRQVPGLGEGDLIMGKGNKSAIGTLVERTSRMVFLVPLKAKTAKTVADAFSDVFEGLSPEIKKSMTYDRGTEMAEHKYFTEKTGIPVYFADLGKH